MGRKPKTIVEKVLEGADKILHPENHATDEVAKQADDASAEVTENKAPPVSESQIEEHKKFDKFQ